MSKLIVIEKATKVTLRGRYNTSGEFITLYLDWGSGKGRSFEFIEDRIYSKPKTPDQSQHNEILLRKAKKKLSLKNVELLNDKTALTRSVSSVDFMTFYNIAKKLPKKGGKPKSEGTLVAYDKAMNSISKIVDLNKVRLRDINKDFVKKIRAKLLETASHNTASLYFQWFTIFLRVAVKEGYLEHNPSDGVDPILFDNSRPINYVFHEDILKLKAAPCHNMDLKRAGLFSSQTGIRAGDIKELKWGSIVKVGDMYRIILKQEKTDKPYVVHFRQEVMDILGDRGRDEELVFPNYVSNGRNGLYLEIWFAHAKVSGRGNPTERFTFHDFRHTFAITLGLNGANLYEISQLLGHSSITTTEKYYARILEQMKQKIVLNLPSINDPIQAS
jgi:integrase